MRENFVDHVTREIRGDELIITCGLPATNKTETMEVVQRLKGFPILRTDLIRKQVLAGEDIFDEKVAASMDKRRLVYDEMFRQAAEAASKGGVILDATFVTSSLRLRAAEVAASQGKTFVIQQTWAPREYSVQKILARTKENYESNALTEQAYDNNVKKFEPIDLDAIRALHPALHVVHLTVETAADDETGWFVIGREERGA